jgi:hypothetical protein
MIASMIDERLQITANHSVNISVVRERNYQPKPRRNEMIRLAAAWQLYGGLKFLRRLTAY